MRIIERMGMGKINGKKQKDLIQVLESITPRSSDVNNDRLP